MSEYETIKQGLILDRDGDPWYYGEEGVEILEQTDYDEASDEWLKTLMKPLQTFGSLRDLTIYDPKELKLPIEYMK